MALLSAGCAMIFWLVGAFMYLAALKNISMLYLKRTGSITLLAYIQQIISYAFQDLEDFHRGVSKLTSHCRFFAPRNISWVHICTLLFRFSEAKLRFMYQNKDASQNILGSHHCLFILFVQ
jgi:hypothetical protein